MRKTVLFTFAALLTSAAVAQTGEITSAKGENWLSQDGDWGLTFDANPLLNYAGNLFNGNTNNSIGSGLTWANPWFAIQGKKMMAADKAYRAKLRIGFGSNKETALVQQAGQSDATVTVEDTHKESNFNLVLGVGMEKRVGSTRVVGVYGAEAYIALGTHKDTYEYGNALNEDNTTPSNSFEQGAGVTESKDGSTFGFGVGAFIGVEWFCAPKISLSGEYTWGLMLSSTGFGETTTESWNSTDNAVETTTVEGPTGKEFNFGIDTGVTGASVGVNFYFQ